MTDLFLHVGLDFVLRVAPDAAWRLYRCDSRELERIGLNPHATARQMAVSLQNNAAAFDASLIAADAWRLQMQGVDAREVMHGLRSVLARITPTTQDVIEARVLQ